MIIVLLRENNNYCSNKFVNCAKSLLPTNTKIVMNNIIMKANLTLSFLMHSNRVINKLIRKTAENYT